MHTHCLALVSLLPCLAFGQSVWIDDSTEPNGEGTDAAPFHWGESADAFDSGIRSLGPGAIIHLRHTSNTQNAFHTRGAYANSVNSSQGFQVKTGQRILGGPGVVIRLVHVEPDRSRNRGYNIALGAISEAFAGGTTANDVLIQDLTLDCNGPELKRVRLYSTIQAIELTGERNVLRNVTVVNAIDDRALAGAYDENFIISLSAYGTSSAGNVIEHCVVKDFIVDKSRDTSANVMCSAITMRVRPIGSDLSHRISGTIQDCTVILNGFKPGTIADQEYALNANFSTNLVIANNIITGATRGFNNDAGPNANLLITGNTFNQSSNSCAVFLSSSCDSTLNGNRFNLMGAGSIAIKVQGLNAGQEATRWHICDNEIRSRVPGNNGIYFQPAPNEGPGMPTGIDVQGNVFTGELAYINVPPNVIRGDNYFARNSGAFRHYTPLSEPAGLPLATPNRPARKL